MPSVFAYLDYRQFLKEFQAERQRRHPSYSVRAFLQKAGISSPSFFRLVVDGKRKLTRQSAERFIAAMGLRESEASYFLALVLFNQAGSHTEAQERYRDLLSLGERARVKVVGEDSFRFYEHWYVPVLREVACMGFSGDDWAALGKRLRPAVTAQQVRDAMKLLLEMGFLVKGSDGGYQQADPLLTTGFEIQSLAVRGFNHQMANLAADAIRDLGPKERNVTGVTMGVSRSTYLLVEQEIRAFQERILRLIGQDVSPEQVYQLQVSLFPLSQLKEPQAGSTE